jgi:Zn-dependent protease with chaperone function
VAENGSARGPRLENRLPAEGINSTDEHPLREFAWLVGSALAALLLVMALIAWGARWLAPHVPFAAEMALAERLGVARPKPEHAVQTAALQQLADRLSSVMQLPAGMTITAVYDDAPMVNAYATIGGRVVVFRGLLHKLRSEDALAALLAHEIAHVKHRHVAAGLGRGLAIATVLGMVSADAGAAVAQSALGQAAGLAMLGYSREQETQSDDDALHAVLALYGHAGGLIELFASLGPAERDGGPALAMLRTHPLTPARLAAVRARAARAGAAIDGSLTPMPAPLRRPR